MPGWRAEALFLQYSLSKYTPQASGVVEGGGRGVKSSHTSHLKIGTPVATLSGAWHYRISAGTGWPGVSIL